MIYNCEEDFYNVKKSRNCENTDLVDYNCAGYALNTFSWYMPYDEDIDGDMEEQVEKLIEDNLTKEEIYNILLSRFTLNMLLDFDNLRVVNDKSELKENERLIYFRIFYELIGDYGDDWEVTPEEYDYVHADFHFRFLEDGYWFEKCGAGGCLTEEDNDEIENSNWVTISNVYDSPIIKLALSMED